MLSFAVLLVFASIAGSFGKPLADDGVDDSPCKTPDQLHGRVFVVLDSGTIIEMTFQSDNHQRAMRFTSETHNLKFDTLMLYDTGIQYTVVADGKICHARKIDHEFHPIAVPDIAHLMGEGKLAGELEIQSYGLKINDTAMMIMVAKDTCIPAYVIAKIAGTTSITTFFDVEVGVDCDAFDIPAICKNVSIAVPNAHSNAGDKAAAQMKRGLTWELPEGEPGQP